MRIESSKFTPLRYLLFSSLTLFQVGGKSGQQHLDYGSTLHRPLSKAEKASNERFLLVAKTEEPGSLMLLDC
jgi:hypothetical protein